LWHFGVLILKTIKNTRVLQLLKGIALLFLINIVSDVMKLPIIHRLLSSISTYGILVLVIIFQPELRKMLEQIATSPIIKYLGISKNEDEKLMKENIYKVSMAATALSQLKVGALIVFEKDIKLKDIIDNGIRINADVSVQLIRNIFEKDTPLHDGAVIISGGRVMSACSILPLAVDSDINKSFGTRHRAAIGISKNSDAIAVVVSEETGKISVARNNMLTVDIKEEGLKKLLLKYLLDIDLEKETKDNDNIILRKMKKVKEKFRKKEMEQSAKVEKG
jgi:TIGR00159 family protein